MRVGAEAFAPERLLEAFGERVCLRVERLAAYAFAEPTGGARRQALGGIDIALHLAKRDRPLRQRAVGVEDGVVGVLPALVGEPGLAAAVIFDEAVAVGVARTVDPAERRLDIGPKLAQRIDVAGVLGIKPGQQHEQRRRIRAAVIKPERDFAQHRHFAAAHFVQDFAGLGVGQRIEVGGLKSRQPPQHAFGDARIAPQHLQRRDDAVAAERGRVPGDAGVRVGALRRAGGQHRQVGHRAAYDLVENHIRAGDGGHAAAGGQALLERRAQALAERQGGVLLAAAFASHRHIDRTRCVRRQGKGVGGGAARQLFRRRVEPDRGAPANIVETVVVHGHRAGADRHVRAAATRTAQAAHFEQVGKVAGKGERKLHVEGQVAVVLQAQPLIGGAVQQKKRAHDVQRVFRLHQLAVEVDVRVGQIDGEDGIVVAHVRTEQQSLPAVEQQFEMREMAGVAKENAIGPPGAAPMSA